MLELNGDRAALLVNPLGQLGKPGDELVIVKVQLHPMEQVAVLVIMDMLNAQRVFDAAGFHHQKPDPAFGQPLIIGYHSRAAGLVVFHKRGPVGCF